MASFLWDTYLQFWDAASKSLMGTMGLILLLRVMLATLYMYCMYLLYEITQQLMNPVPPELSACLVHWPNLP